MPATVFTLLKKDHTLVKKLFTRLEDLELSDLSERQQLFQQLKCELDIHSKLEEALLYAPLKDINKTHTSILEATEEHHLVEKLLIDLSSGPMNTEEWCAKLTVLKENVLHHIKEEESELFPLAEKALDREQLIQIGKQLQTQRKKLESSVLALV